LSQGTASQPAEKLDSESGSYPGKTLALGEKVAFAITSYQGMALVMP
jgi:hypothetical protein